MKELLTALVLAMSFGGLAMASEEDDLTSLSYISYLERYATVQPASQEQSLEAVSNLPLVAGDRIDTARQARVEVVLADRSIVWVNEYSSLSFDAVAASRDTQSDRTVLFLAEGSLMLEIPDYTLAPRATRIDSKDGTVYLNQHGLYRVDALLSGGLRVEVWTGLAEVATSSGGVLVRSESAAEVASGLMSAIDTHLSWDDDFARWVDQRRHVVPGDSVRYVDAQYQREAAQLDNYGSWIYVNSYNTWAWQPSVSTGWRPYTYGRWYWTPTGWSWISYEPWGWLPYHYGSWFLDARAGWVWMWDPYWSPAWVSWVYWPGHVGWCPRGYYDYWWWHNYQGWYGYDHPRPGHGGPGGGGQPPPRRADVIPRPERVGGAGDVKPGTPLPPSRFAIDLAGRAELRQIDGDGWNVVTTEEFASPNLPRLVIPGEVALARTDDLRGVVTSGPLRTASPALARPEGELERAFARADSSPTRDLSPVLARSAELPAEQALRLVEPTTSEMLSRRTSRGSQVEQPAPRSRERTVRDQIVIRRSSPNVHRPSATSSETLGGGPVVLDRQPLARSGSKPTDSVGSSRPIIRPPVERTVPGSVTVAPRSNSAYERGPTSGQRVVIVPRTSSDRPSRVITRSTAPSPSARPRMSPSSSSGGSRSSAPRPSTASGSSGSASSSGSRASSTAGSPTSSSASSSRPHKK